MWLSLLASLLLLNFFFQAEDGIRDLTVTGVQTCALPILNAAAGEVCDDGNRQAGDGCSANCKTIETGYTCGSAGSLCEKCGNGIKVAPEACEDRKSVV